MAPVKSVSKSARIVALGISAKLFLALFAMALSLSGCGGSVESAPDPAAPVCVSSVASDTGDQSVCPLVGLTVVECSAPASRAQLARYGQCEAGLAHTNTYCCAPARTAPGFECGGIEIGVYGSITYGISNAAVESCAAIGGVCLPADPAQHDGPVVCTVPAPAGGAQ